MRNTLNLTLKKKWFDMIASGEKKEEYREIKDYWIKRLLVIYYPFEAKDDLKFLAEDLIFDSHKHYWKSVLKAYYSEVKDYDFVSANNGYAKGCPNIKWEHMGTRIGKPNPAWCEPEDADKTVFILSIGNLLTEPSKPSFLGEG